MLFNIVVVVLWPSCVNRTEAWSASLWLYGNTKF